MRALVNDHELVVRWRRRECAGTRYIAHSFSIHKILLAHFLVRQVSEGGCRGGHHAAKHRITTPIVALTQLALLLHQIGARVPLKDLLGLRELIAATVRQRAVVLLVQQWVTLARCS